MSAIITGEAVILELRPASFAARSLGSAIDVLVTIVLVIAALWAIGSASLLLDPAAAKALTITTLVFLIVIVPIAVETLSRGKSLGKLVMGLRVVRDDGGAIRFRQALIRGMVGVFEIYLTVGSVAFLASLFNERSKRLGDMMAGTYAIRERAARIAPLQAHTVPELAGWAALADIGRIPDPVARRISVFLRQGAAMAPASRHALGTSLATEASAFIAPLPPHGTPPEIFLAALISERRDREFALLTRTEDQAESLRARLARHGVKDS